MAIFNSYVSFPEGIVRVFLLLQEIPTGSAHDLEHHSASMLRTSILWLHFWLLPACHLDFADEDRPLGQSIGVHWGEG